MTITLTGDPLSTNHIYKITASGGFARMYMTQEAKERKEQYVWEARSQYRGEPKKGYLSITVVYYLGNKRRRDLDNQKKLVYDSLTGIAWEDDSQIYQEHIYKRFDKANPRIEIVIVPAMG